tara:strand:- start:6924 stop:7394 length:471 start_codon:yes stop_codon:yes gene_type:complete
MAKNKSNKKHKDQDIEVEWSNASDDKLFLNDMTPKTGHLSNLSTNKKGKEISVGKQISDYLKSMELLEKSIPKLEKTIEKSNKILKILSEANIVKKKYRGKIYSTTRDMIRAVNLYENGKITYSDLLETASWSLDPKALIDISQMIAGTGKFKKRR